MSEIIYARGDATVPSVKGLRVIAHVCNVAPLGSGTLVVGPPDSGCLHVARGWSRPRGEPHIDTAPRPFRARASPYVASDSTLRIDAANTLPIG